MSAVSQEDGMHGLDEMRRADRHCQLETNQWAAARARHGSEG